MAKISEPIGMQETQIQKLPTFPLMAIRFIFNMNSRLPHKFLNEWIKNHPRTTDGQIFLSSMSGASQQRERMTKYNICGVAKKRFTVCLRHKLHLQFELQR